MKEELDVAWNIIAMKQALFNSVQDKPVSVGNANVNQAAGQVLQKESENKLIYLIIRYKRITH